jgi:type IX secretion system PorP/SprF family membrane protein
MISGISIRSLTIIIILIVSLPQDADTQDIDSDMVYSLNLLANPAFSGSRGEGILKLVYRDYYPGNNLNLNSVFLSYDTYLEPIQGGIGFYLLESRLGDILNDLRSGASYSYHLRAGNDLYINAGFMASLIYRSYNKTKLVFPDQIDPILGPVLETGEIIDFRPRILFDVSVGFLISYKNFNSGVAISHLGKPDLSGRNVEDGRLKRRLTFHADAIFETGLQGLKVQPLFFTNLQGQFLSGAAGGGVIFNPLTISVLFHIDSNDGIYAMQPGFAFETGRFTIGYNYFFNAFKVDTAIPRSHSNLLSISISLNNVDNSGVMKAINLPKL